jgi:hypothetical protein
VKGLQTTLGNALFSSQCAYIYASGDFSLQVGTVCISVVQPNLVANVVINQAYAFSDMFFAVETTGITPNSNTQMGNIFLSNTNFNAFRWTLPLANVLSAPSCPCSLAETNGEVDFWAKISVTGPDSNGAISTQTATIGGEPNGGCNIFSDIS